VHLATPWLHRNPSPAPWGWDFEAGPAQGLFFAFTLLCVLPAAAVASRHLRDDPSPAKRSQLQPLVLAVAVPLVFASLTGALLPMAGVPTPRLGPASFAVLGATVAWSYTRYGFSALAPGSFSREILETLPDGVALLALDGGIRNANGALERLLGDSAGELASVSIERRLDRVVVDEADLREVECQLATPSGPIPVSISTSRLCDKKGLALGVVLVVRDLRELVGLRNRLATSGRLAAVGQLAAGIAHEINNPTAYVRANLAQLRSAWGELAKHVRHRNTTSELAALVAEGEELIDESLEGVERTASIVRDVKGFAHGGSGIIEKVDANEILGEVLRMAQAQLPEGVAVEVRLSDVPRVSGISQELKQVFLNLVINAIQAIDGEGRVEVTTRSERGEVYVRVADDGCGIAPEHCERIFDPFFTTKPVGEGTGLGLAISYQILRSHGAAIQLETEPGRGTAFTVRFRALESVS
jgi:signal transduction histidine kinase